MSQRRKLSELTLSVIDTETTHLSPAKGGRIAEIAIVRIEAGGEITDRYETLVNPFGDVGRSDIHGISQAMADAAPSFADVVPEISERLVGTVVVAHNIAFDWPFVVAEFDRTGTPAPDATRICTLRGARARLGLTSNTLAKCCETFGIELINAHCALDDTVATAQLALVMIARAEAAGRGYVADRAWFDQVVATADLTSFAARPRRRDALVA